jgi:hypothetical protein
MALRRRANAASVRGLALSVLGRKVDEVMKIQNGSKHAELTSPSGFRRGYS